MRSAQKTPSQISFIQNIETRLKTIKNSYDGEMRLFDHVGVPLVNYNDDEELKTWPPDARQIYVKTRDTAIHTFLTDRQTRPHTLSIIIPIRGRSTYLRYCLASLSQQTFIRNLPDLAEIIVVQDGPDASGNPLDGPEIHEIMRKFSSGVRFKLVRLSTNYGRSTPRNFGIHFASNEIVLLVDSTMVLERGFVTEHMLRHSRCSNIALLGFKENLSMQEYEAKIGSIHASEYRPNYRKDWKYHVTTHP